MGLEESILQAGNILEGASGAVNKGLSIFDNVAKTFGFSSTPIVGSDPAGEMGGQEEISSPKTPAQKSSSVGLLIVGGIALYLFLR